jgi:hypothetical protein
VDERRFLVTTSGGRLRPLIPQLMTVDELRVEFEEDWGRNPGEWERFSSTARPGDWVLVQNDDGSWRASVVCAYEEAWA